MPDSTIKTAPYQPPLQPRGWPLSAYRNIAVQERQAADRQRARVDQLSRRCRRLRATTAGALAIVGAVGLTMLCLGLVVGYAVGVGLMRAIGQ